jgi:hypothetical protein
MHPLGVVGKSGSLVAQQVREADAADDLQGGLDGHRRIEGNGRGTHWLGWRGFSGDGGVAALGFAARLNAQRRGRRSPWLC